MFDQKTIEQIKFYVYALIHPVSNKPFYIGKGQANRIFNHLKFALDFETEDDKYNTIREIVAQDKSVKYVIIRHGLTEKEAFEVEATLIDFSLFLGLETTNKVGGHHSEIKGIMTADEIIRLYKAEPLNKLEDKVIIININREYKRARDEKSIYEATKERWVIAEYRRKEIKYVLSEFRGLIIEVFEIDHWYPVSTTDLNGKEKIRWGFNGKVAPESIRSKYLNKSVAHHKSKGTANPIRYNLN